MSEANVYSLLLLIRFRNELAMKLVKYIKQAIKVIEVEKNVSSKDKINAWSCFCLNCTQMLLIAPEEGHCFHALIHSILCNIPRNQRHHGVNICRDNLGVIARYSLCHLTRCKATASSKLDSCFLRQIKVFFDEFGHHNCCIIDTRGWLSV